MVSNNFSGIELVNPEQLSNALTNVFAFILFLNKSSGIDVKLEHPLNILLKFVAFMQLANKLFGILVKDLQP